MSTKQVGSLGEKITEDYLKNKGYEILDRNYNFRIPGSPQKGEIDLVAKKSDTISFVEVKSLVAFIKNKGGRASFISPEEKVNFAKQRKLRLTAESWLMKKRIPLNSKWQIDVASVIIDRGTRKAQINYFENAIPYR